MINLIVQRGLGDKQGPDITDPLLSSIPVALARGTQEIDSSTSVDNIVLTTTYRSGVELGQLAEVHDALQGKTWRGKIVGVTHAVRGPTIFTDLDVERL